MPSTSECGHFICTTCHLCLITCFSFSSVDRLLCCLFFSVFIAASSSPGRRRRTRAHANTHSPFAHIRKRVWIVCVRAFAFECSNLPRNSCKFNDIGPSREKSVCSFLCVCAGSGSWNTQLGPGDSSARDAKQINTHILWL